ncbi:pitrilysin family protein [Alkalicoccus chagannorensis]
METMHFEQLQETLYKEKLDNGLEVFLLPKEGFQKAFAVFTTKYGSVDDRFIPIGGTEPVQLPDGVAHFLEHKMFEDEDGDVFQEFSRQGASANAFTSFTRTAYLFSSTSGVSNSLETLLNFVQKPYFTDATVEKEKGIIEQEINMYQDNPDWQNFFGLLKAMYHRHPVRTDIAGTVSSIYDISKEDLYMAYETFYHPASMVLFIVGAVEPESTMKQIRENQQAKTFPDPEEPVRFQADEPEEVFEKSVTMAMPVQVGRCLIGFKEKNPFRRGRDLLKRELSAQLVLEMMFGQSSDGYASLFSRGLIDETFSFDYTAEEGFGFSVIGSDTTSPQELDDAVSGIIQSAQREGLSEAAFERLKKKKIGFFLRAMNSPEFIANQFTRYHMNEMQLFDVIPVLESLTLHDLDEVLQEHFDLSRQKSVHMIYPEESVTS